MANNEITHTNICVIDFTPQEIKDTLHRMIVECALSTYGNDVMRHNIMLLNALYDGVIENSNEGTVTE